MESQAKFYRLYQIIGDASRGIAPIVPISKSSWYDGINKGRYPRQVKIGPNTAVWRADEIHRLVEGGEHEIV